MAQHQRWNMKNNGIHIWNRVRFVGLFFVPFLIDPVLENMRTRTNTEYSIRKSLLKSARIWMQRLTGFEKYAIEKYTYNSTDRKDEKFFAELNYLLRTISYLTPLFQRYATAISNAIDKFEIPFDLVVYRSQDFGLGDYDIGDVITIHQFFSTSIRKTGVLKNKKYFFTILVNKKTRGAYIELLSHFPWQYELLLDRGLKYEILDIYGNEYLLEVIVDEKE